MRTQQQVDEAASGGRAPLRVAVVGAAGYTGVELLRLLLEHPHARIVAVYGRSRVGESIAEIFPSLAGRLELALRALDVDELADSADVAFLSLPHGESAPVAHALAERGVLVCDLSADLRLRDARVHTEWYGGADADSPLRARAVYGLPERHRAELATARVIAVPGCYPTATILAIAPLLARGLVSPDGLIVDAKSGVSGAGRTPALAAHFPEAGEGLRPYKVAGTHRHTPEIEQELALAAGRELRLTFTPHLAPMSRGILACVYATPTSPTRAAAEYQAALVEAYADEPFVVVLPPGQLPDTAAVRGSNRAHVAVALDARAGRVLAIAAIDNLVKGAAGQAIQCMNLARGLPERAGLDGAALFP